MNFFEHQARARRNAAYRMLLTIGILLTPAILWTYVSSLIFGEVHWYEPLAVCGVMLPFVASGYWYQIRKLKGGGSAIAEKLGAVLISDQPDEDDRWVLEIVEEMAIASGNPVPPVYLLDTDGVNAFAAGRTPQDSVISVTLGAFYILNYEEMRAVIAELFSQIQNNDMRVDAQMTGVYSGIACLALLLGLAGGYTLIIGLGWAYLVFLAMSRVIRERKYLADAAAAQFTRNPLSVASALKKIGGYEYGSVIGCRESEDFLQMYFAAPFEELGKRWVAPHPPLEKRIWRLDPDWDGEYPDVPPLESLMGDDEQADENLRRWEVLGAVGAAVSATRQTGEEPNAWDLYLARVALDSICDVVTAAARHPDSARALIYRLLLSDDAPSREYQESQLQGCPDQEILHHMHALKGPMANLDRYLRLPLIDLCVPALKQLTPAQYKVLTDTIMVLCSVDAKTILTGWALVQILNARVPGRRQLLGLYTLSQRESDVTLLLGLFAAMGHRSDSQAELAYYRACDVLPFYTAPRDDLDEEDTLKSLDKRLTHLRQLKSEEKETLMDAIAVCIETDGHITPEEIELMRAMADALDCPMPEGLETPSFETADAELLPA
ncbi:M48 family metalloprotease [Pseudomonas sp.]|uniref:M48 family metalloprotease n=1 Tax=Pseudomonas sp. TaxID=306 RepID=UPI003264B6E0